MKFTSTSWTKTLLAVLAMLFLSQLFARASQSVSIGWTASPSPDVIGYFVHSGPLDQSSTNVIDVGNVTAVTISNLEEGEAYFFYVTAYNAIGIESAPSD